MTNRTRTRTLLALCAALVLGPVSPAVSVSAAAPESGMPALLPSYPVLQPSLPVTTDQYTTIWEVKDIPTWFEWTTTISRTFTEDYVEYGGRDVYTKVDGARFLFDALSYSASAKATALDELRTAINNGFLSPYYGTPGYSFSVGFLGLADPRCTASNYPQLGSTACDTLTDAQALSYGYHPNTRKLPEWINFTRASQWLGTYGKRKGNTSRANGLLGSQRAADVMYQLQLRFEAKQPGVWASKIDPILQQYSIGDWYAYHTEAQCRGGESVCAEERRAEVVVYYRYVVYDVPITKSRTVTTTSVVTEGEWRNVATPVSRQVNCTYYGTCLTDAPSFTSSPIVMVPRYAQPNRPHQFKLTPVTVACSATSAVPCTSGVTSGAATTGWGNPQIVSAVFSGFGPQSLTAPPGYSSPTQYEISGLPSGSANSNQAFTVTFKNATRSGESYTLLPGSVTVTAQFTPWLWDGSSLTWLTGNSTTRTVTVPVKCTNPAPDAGRCSFEVLGTNVAE